LKPTPVELIQALERLLEEPPTFSPPTPESQRVEPRVDPAGVPRYLSGIISSSLSWIDDEATKEKIWELASLRLNERSGRNAMPSMTRSFQITTELIVKLHEPSLTGDNLGLKTWTSSLLLARLLPRLQELIPRDHRILELGSGTGLLGLSAACLWKAEVLLTDLPEVVTNLETNLFLNSGTVTSHGGSVSATALDWSDETDVLKHNLERFQVIIAADPIYSPDHPRILVDTISRWLTFDKDARVVLTLPLRPHYDQERSELRRLLTQANLSMLLEGTETGYDDWYTQDGSQAEVECWWSIWQPSAS
jgi:predicted nicotinamide N-methyase